MGATGVYQIVEVVQHLCEDAGQNQLDGTSIGMAHNIGGSGSNIVIHVLRSIVNPLTSKRFAISPFRGYD